LHACHIHHHITHGIVTDQKLGISKEDSTCSSCPHSIVAISWQWHPRLLARGAGLQFVQWAKRKE